MGISCSFSFNQVHMIDYRKTLTLAGKFVARWLPSFAHRLKFFLIHHYWPHLKDPRTFSEKLHYRVHCAEDPYYRLYGCKFTAPYYLQQKTDMEVHIPRRYGVYRTLSLEDIESWPEQLVLKSSFAAGLNRIIYDKSSIDPVELCRTFNRDIRRIKNSQNKRDPFAVIIAEELLLLPSGAIPEDYKFHCFHNSNDEFQFLLQVDRDRFQNHGQDIYDSDLKPVPYTWNLRPKSGQAFHPPKNFDQMIAIARQLSRDFDYMRIDLYNIEGKIYFGEFTPYHRGGKAPIYPRAWDYKLGEMWP